MLTFRHNNIQIKSISEFDKIYCNTQENVRDTYFVRLVGVNSSLGRELDIMEERAKGIKDGSLYYKRLEELPKLCEFECIEFYSACYQNWVNGNRRNMIIKTTKGQLELGEILSSACVQLTSIYGGNKGSINSSIEKNFIVKIIYWFDHVMNNFLINWRENINIKIVAQNISNKQEYLFYYMLTMIGADVLLIQSERDIDSGLELLKLSQKHIAGNMGKLTLLDCEPQRVRISIPQHPRAVKSLSNQEAQVNQEKSFEELARLASSVVMIAIHDRKGEVIGTGSGIMVGKKGYILTNNHVASGGCFYSVCIENDSQVYKTDELIKYNPMLDLAIIRINREIEPLPIYRGSKELVRGQRVVAIGSPLGLFNSVSNGIISGFRKIDDIDMIQFTAPISHGSSGGAVLNMYGEVIGISTAGIDAGQNINLAMDFQCINTFIKGFTS